MVNINNNKIKGLGGIKRAYLNNTLIFQAFKKDEEVIPQYDITSTFNVTSTTSPTQLCHSSAISYFTEMYVDGVQIDVASGYTFSTTGEHTVQYMLADKTTIGDNALFGCFNLKSVTIGSGVKTINYRSFFNCNKLTSVTIGSGVKTIGDQVFWNCLSLTSIDIPSNVETIGSSALGSCTSLTSVTIPSSVTNIGNDAFVDSLIHTDNFINNSSATGYPWGATLYDTAQDDGLYILGTTVVKCNENATNVTIPESITSISNGAFKSCSSLNEITCLGTTAPTLEGTNVFISLQESGTLTYPCESDYSAWLEQLRWKDTCNQGGQEGWVTLTQYTDRSIQMQTFRIDTTEPEMSSGYYFITFSISPDYPGENADITDFSICINENRIFDNGSRKYISDQKHIEGNVYEYTFSVPVYFAGGERNAPLSQVQYKGTIEDTPEEEVSPYDITAKFDVNSTTSKTVICFSAYTSDFTEMYIDGVLVSPTSAYTFSSTGEHTVGYMLKDKTKLAGVSTNGHFKGCSRMKEIKFKDELTTISGSTFSGCTSLQKVTFGSGLTSVGSSGGFSFSIFTGCTNLREIICLAPTAPTLLKKSIQGIENNKGVLYVPQGSDYRPWEAILKSWTIRYIN